MRQFRQAYLRQIRITDIPTILTWSWT